MNPSVERCDLAPDLSISRVLTGLWQIADMERDGGTLDPDAAAADTVDPRNAGVLGEEDIIDVDAHGTEAVEFTLRQGGALYVAVERAAAFQ